MKAALVAKPGSAEPVRDGLKDRGLWLFPQASPANDGWLAWVRLLLQIMSRENDQTEKRSNLLQR
jgi:hypothetical protein